MNVKKAMIAAAVVACGTVMMTVPSCDGVLFDSSVSDSPGYYYGTGYDSGWWPSLPGAPLVSPYYWGGQVYPGNWYPPARPPVNRPVWRPPLTNSGSGNVRPGTSVPSAPVQPSVPVRPGSGAGQGSSNSVVPPAGTIRPGAVTGGQPGIAMPPEGMGLRPGRH